MRQPTLSDRPVPFLAALLATVLGLNAAAPALARNGSEPVRLQRELAPRWIAPKGERVVLTPGHDTRRVVLKVLDDSFAEARGGRLVATVARPGLPALCTMLDDMGARVEPLFDVPAGELEKLRRAGEARIHQELADLSQYFLVELDGNESVARLIALRANESVEEAYFATLPPPAPGDYAPTTPLWEDCAVSTPCQGYLDPAPGGIDSRWAQTLLSGKGGGRRIADVEYAWNINGLFGSTTGHEDLGKVNGQSPSAAVWDTTSWSNPFPGDTNHGTAAAGILCADLDAWGVSGIAPNAKLRVSAAYTTSGLNIAAAILRASRVLRPGDTILVEMQNFGPNYGGSGQLGMVPVEYYSAEFNAIKQVTAMCIHVVEAAGNGEQDFGSAVAPYGDATYAQRLDPRSRHSRAVMIGAGTSNAPHLRMWFSNFGTRVDAYAWGENVVTLGYGDLWSGGAASPDVDQYYTNTFAGTSSASAIVAGGTTVLNAMHNRLHRQAWSPTAMGRFLRTSGTDTSALYNEQIGRQPDLFDQLEIVGMGPQPALVFTDESAGAFVLDDVASLGDLDQDGTPDYGVGSSQAGATGRVTIYSGLTGEVLATLSGPAIGDQFGRSLASVSDLTGDGVPDIVVGAPKNTVGGVDAGQVHVYSGVSFALLYTKTGVALEDLGHSVAGIGDVDGDGYGDFAAGAFGYSSGTGRVIAWSGQTGAVLFTWYGSAAGEHFGQAIAGAGDVDGDGTPDVVVGAPLAGGLQNGAARVFSGSTGNQIRAWSSFNNYAWFGFAVAGAGDVNGDGNDDVLVGAPSSNGTAGYAQLFSGANGSELLPNSFFGNSNSNFGGSVAGAGDVNGDGTPDILVGASLDSLGFNSSEGAAHLYDGTNGQLIRSYHGQKSFSYLGTSVSTAGDLDGDGRDDVFLGAQWWHASNGDAGRGYVFLSPNPCTVSPVAPQ